MLDHEAAKEAWRARVLDQPLVVDELEHDTWYGVVIGFFLGYGFPLPDAIALSQEVAY